MLNLSHTVRRMYVRSQRDKMPEFHKEVKYCKYEDCLRPHFCRGYCTGHYDQLRKGKDLRPLAERYRNLDAFCYFEDCKRPPHSKGLCSAHASILRKEGILRPLGHSGRSKVPDGHTRIISEGYVLEKCDGHPNADKRGFVRQHVKVMAEVLQRPLLQGENVHHKNGIKHDNRPENLELWTTHQPKGQRIDDITTWAVEWLKQYAPEKLKED